MKKVLLLFLCSLAIHVFAAKAVQAEESGYVEISKPFVNIYEYLDPKSNILKQARKGEVFELIYEGKSWYQIKFNDKVGWIEKRSGTIVAAPKMMFYSIPMGTFALFIILLLGTIVTVSLMIFRHKKTEFEHQL